MTKKVIDDSNLGHLVSKAKAAFWPKEDVINVNLADVATSGDYNDLSNKPTIPDVSNFITKSVNDLTNYYLKSETYTKEEVAALIGAIQQFHYEIATSTSAVTSPANNVLYLIGPTGSGSDKYEEYVYDETKPVAERWIKIGDTTIDLSGYVTTQALNTALAGKQNSLVSGTNIKTLNGDSLLGSGNLTSAYIVEVSLTLNSETRKYSASIVSGSIAEIKAALSSNKTVIAKCVYSGSALYLRAVSKESDTEIIFGGAYSYLGLSFTCSLAWTESSEGENVYFEQILHFSGITVSGSGNAITELTPNEIGGYQVAATATKGSTFVDTAEQTLTDAQKSQARTNIGAGTYSKPSGGIPASDIASGVIPATPVNADWNATSGLAQILNKPTIPTTYAGSPTAGGFANKTVAIPFGSVDSTSTATEITATVDNFPETLTDGVCAYIRNNVISSASGWTLNINGTGEKPVYNTIADATRVSSVFNANSTYLFVYNSSRVEGGCWDIYYGYNANDNTVGYMLRTNGASTPPAAQKYYRYRLLFTAANGLSLVPANTSSSTSATAAKTVNQTKIDPFGVIFYYSYSSAVNASASPSAAYLWMQYNGITLGYSFNRTGEALEMTARDPVYLKCAPQSDGSAIIDADNPIVQALPTTADGKIYIFLGFAESATNITLYYWHPVYYHDGTRIVIWSGKQDTLTFDTIPTENSTNPVTSGGIYNAITENEQVTAAALNDLNDRTTILEEGDSQLKQRYIIGTAEEEQYDIDAYIKQSVPDPREGDVFITYDDTKRTLQQNLGSVTITFDDYQQQGWPSSTGTFIKFEVPIAAVPYLELVTTDTGDYKFYTNPNTDEQQYPNELVSITNDDLCTDGKYRHRFSMWTDEYTYLYYSGTMPDVELYKCLPESDEYEYYHGDWVCRREIRKFAQYSVTSGSSGISSYYLTIPSGKAVAEELTNYPRVDEFRERYTTDIQNDPSAKDSPLTFAYIQNVSNSSTSIYFKCSTSNTTVKTVQVDTGDDTWTNKTPDTLDSDGTYYVLLGTITSTNPILRVKGTNTSYGNSTDYCKFHVDGPCYMYGDLISLVGGHTGTNNDDISDAVYNGNYTFPYMFKDEVNIYSHPLKNLYLITDRVANNAYYGMFYGCSNIVKTPIINARTYNRNFSSQMFYYCPNLKILLAGSSISVNSTTRQGLINTGGHYQYIIGNIDISNLIRLGYDSVISSYSATNDLSQWFALATSIVREQNSILFEELKKYVIWDSSSAQFTLLPNKINNLGTLNNSTSRTFILKEDNWTGIHHYFWMFNTTDTVPTFVWPTGLIWPGGSPPAILPNKHYEISVLNNIVAWMEV